MFDVHNLFLIPAFIAHTGKRIADFLEMLFELAQNNL
jgi:hypothetical protein